MAALFSSQVSLSVRWWYCQWRFTDSPTGEGAGVWTSNAARNTTLVHLLFFSFFTFPVFGYHSPAGHHSLDQVHCREWRPDDIGRVVLGLIESTMISLVLKIDISIETSGISKNMITDLTAVCSDFCFRTCPNISFIHFIVTVITVKYYGGDLHGLPKPQCMCGFVANSCMAPLMPFNQALSSSCWSLR